MIQNILIAFALIVSGLALWAARRNYRALMEDKKRSEKQRAAMIHYVDKTVDLFRLEFGEKLGMAKKDLQDLNRKSRAELFESGEWEKAVMQAAESKIAEAVTEICGKMSSAYFENDFNASLGNILGFDPYDAVRAQREKDRKGERR